MQRIRFQIGEERHVRILIHATDGAPFTIRNAGWELKQYGTAEDSGECGIKDQILDAFIAPKKRTAYQLVFTYQIADETLVECIEVVVE